MLDTQLFLRHSIYVMNETKVRRINIKLDPETHRKLKMKAITDGVTMQAFMVQLIKQAVYTTQK